MTEVMQNLCPHFTPEQMKALFEAADSNRNGSIDYEEFIKFIMEPAKELTPEEIEALRAVFNRFDLNKDGYHSPTEFTTCLQNMLPARAGDFDAADMDGDGLIDFDEFLRYWTSIMGSPGF